MTLKVIGTNPSTGEVLVRNTATGEMNWQSGTKEQIKTVTKAIKKAEPTGKKVEYPEYKAPIPVVIGTSPTTKELLVRDVKTGEEYYKPGTKEQITEATKIIQEGSKYDKPYLPPKGLTKEQPIPGTLVTTPTARATSIKVYDYRGSPKTLTIKQYESLFKKDEFDVPSAVALGVLQEGSIAAEGGYIPGWAVKARKAHAAELAKLTPSQRAEVEATGSYTIMESDASITERIKADHPEASNIVINRLTGAVTYTVPPVPMTDTQIITLMKSEGKIPEKATDIKITREKGEIEVGYLPPPTGPSYDIKTLEARFLKEPDQYQLEVTDTALEGFRAGLTLTGGIGAILGGILPRPYYTKLSKEDKQKVLEAYAKLTLASTGKVTTLKLPAIAIPAAQVIKLSGWEETIEGADPLKSPEEFNKVFGQASKIVAGFVPVVGTILYWDDMKDAEGNLTWMHATSIALDVAILAPYVKAGIGALRGIRAPTRVAAESLAKVEAKAAKQMATKLTKACGKEVGSSYTAMSKAQQNYLKRLASIEDLTKRGATTTTKAIKAIEAKLVVTKDLKVAQLLRDRIANLRGKTPLGKANKLALKAEQGLQDKTRQFVKLAKGNIGFDSPMVAKMMDEMPKEIVLNTRSAITSLKSTKANIRALEAAVVRAESKLKAAQAKFSSEPSKWSDLMFDYAKKQSELAVAKTGNVEALYRKLLAARKAGKLTEAARLQIEFDKAVKSMEIEWMKGGLLSSGGGGQIAIAGPPGEALLRGPMAIAIPKASKIMEGALIKGAIVGTALAGASRVTVGAELFKTIINTPTSKFSIPLAELANMTASNIEAKYGEKIFIAPTYISPEAETAAMILTAPDIVGMEWLSPAQAVARATELAVNAYTEAAVKAATEAATKAIQMSATEEEVKTAAETAAKIQLEPISQTELKTIIATRVETAIRQKTHLRIFIPIIPTSLEGVEPKKRKKEYAPGTVVWKQGIYWKIIPPPYTVKKPISSRIPPAGVTRLKGNPQETLAFIGGIVPASDIDFDLGVTDGFIDVSKKRIVYGGHGERTDVGKRLPSHTKGLTIRARRVKRVRPISVAAGIISMRGLR